MLISKKKKFIFVHVQKTAGTSLQKVLRSNVPDTKLWLGRHGRAVDGVAAIGRERWERYFSFGFVRNPWDRLVSHYSMIRDRITELTPEQRREAHPFKIELWNYVLHFSEDFESFLDNCTGLIWDRDCYKSFLFNQLDYLEDDEGQLLVDYVGRFENFEHDARQTLEKIGIEADVPRLNPSSRGDYRQYFNPRTRDLVAERFKRDIEAFGYEF